MYHKYIFFPIITSFVLLLQIFARLIPMDLESKPRVYFHSNLTVRNTTGVHGLLKRTKDLGVQRRSTALVYCDWDIGDIANRTVLLKVTIIVKRPQFIFLALNYLMLIYYFVINS